MENQIQQKQKSNIFITLSWLIIIALIFFIGLFIGLKKNPNVDQILDIVATTQASEGDEEEAKINFDPYWKAWNLLNQKFIDIEDIDAEDKLWGSIKGLAESMGDPYTTFFTPEETKSFENSINGEFGGIGIEIDIEDGYLTIVTPLKNTPGEEAGLIPGDIIAAVDGLNTFEMTINESISMMRGKKGEPVILTIWRDSVDDPFDVEIIRDVIHVPAIETEVVNGVFVIHFYSFSSDSQAEFEDALDELLLKKYDKVLIDLRNNPGGFLDTSIEIASWFLESGKIVVSEEFKDETKNKHYRSKGYDIKKFHDFELGVLVNRGSASASEILSGALKEHGVATIYGETTFGKGTVQEFIPITKETALKVTTSRWLTPDGTSISDGGLDPDIETELNFDSENYSSYSQLIEVVNLMNE
jgi:carboxyl-terminal processing protease